MLGGAFFKNNFFFNPRYRYFRKFQTILIKCFSNFTTFYNCTTSFNQAWTQVLRRFKPCSRRVGDSRWLGSLTMMPAGNKAKTPFVGQPFRKNNSSSSSSSSSSSKTELETGYKEPYVTVASQIFERVKILEKKRNLNIGRRHNLVQSPL